MDRAGHSSAGASIPPANGQARPGGLTPDDILYTLFRHKALIVGFVCLALVGAVAVRFVRPPLFVSKAKLMVHYVVESRGANPSGPGEEQSVRPVDFNAQQLINSEIEILTSLDVAKQVVAKVGAARILARKGGGDNPLWAAGAVSSGITVEPARSSIITVLFKHPDPEIVQPVLEALIHTYMLKHLQVHQGVGELEGYYVQQKDELRKKLAETEEELKRAKAGGNLLFLEDTKRSYQAQITRLENELLDAQRELAERQAVLGNLGAGTGSSASANIATNPVPLETLTDYGDLVSSIDSLKKQERELLLSYKEAYPLVQTVRGQIAKFSQEKSQLERAFPSLAQVIPAGRFDTNTTGGGIASQVSELKRINARVSSLQSSLATIKAQAARVLDMEPQIAELERRRSEEQKNYDFIVSRLDATKKGESLAAGNVLNMSVVENPTPPKLDFKKLIKLLGVVFGGCVGMGIGLAFFIDLVLDRTIKRASDVERHLRMPVFLTIPNTATNGRARARWWFLPRRKPATQSVVAVDPEGGSAQTALAVWDPQHQLSAYTEGLRERVMTYFEVRNLDLKKPKMVAVTGCTEGAGVSTLASGLAASLSKTGDGNVLLVDMNSEQGIAHSFYKGQPGCGVNDVLEPENRAEAMVQEKLYVASFDQEQSGALEKSKPQRFNHLMPKLKASDYDYIIFDMPPVTPTSSTPRLSGHMDIVLLVLESEKTSQHTAARASALMRDARANVAAVVNKHSSHMPEGLSHD